MDKEANSNHCAGCGSDIKRGHLCGECDRGSLWIGENLIQLANGIVIELEDHRAQEDYIDS